MNKETAIQNEILLALSEAGALAWRVHVGKFRALNNPAQVISVGTPGQADVMAVVPVVITPDMVGQVIGVALAVEVKTETGTQQKAQKLWEHALKRRGGVYTIARSADQVGRILDRVRSIGRQ